MRFSDVILRGLRADQPSFLVAPVGALYFVTDENVLERNAGTSWQSYSPASPVSGPGSAVVDDSLVRFSSTTGQAIQGSLITLTDAGILGFPDDVRQTFNPGATTPGVNVGSFAGDPSAPANGDAWYNSTSNQWKVRANGVTIVIGAGDWDETITKTVNESVTNSTAYIEDAELFKTLVISSVYRVEFVIMYSGDSAAADFKWEWRFGSLLTVNGNFSGWFQGVTTALGVQSPTGEIGNNVGVDNFWGNLTQGTDALHTKFVLSGQFYLTTPAAFDNDGRVRFRFAQNSAGGAGTEVTVYAGSYFRYKKIF